MKYILYYRSKLGHERVLYETYNNFHDCKAASEDLLLKNYRTKIEQVIGI
jgi:5-methylcytosine-specific restriction endonuclease McrBC GTP-binding regulatory subunit McrB